MAVLWKTHPVQRARVTVSEKENIIKHAPAHVFSGIGASITPETSAAAYALTMRTDSGRHYKFRVSRKLYESLSEGDTGSLIFKKKGGLTEFVSFEKEAPPA